MLIKDREALKLQIGCSCESKELFRFSDLSVKGQCHVELQQQYSMQLI